MILSVQSETCPACGAPLRVERGKKLVICEYCWSRVLVSFDESGAVSVVDEVSARKKAEDERLAAERAREERARAREALEREQAEKRRRRELALRAWRRRRALMSLAALLVGLIALPFALVGLIALSDTSEYGLASVLLGIGALLFWGASALWKKGRTPFEGEPEAMAEVPGGGGGSEHFTHALERFRGAGFTQIQCVPLNDLRLGILDKPGVVEKITVGGKEVASGGGRYRRDAAVVITYHSMKPK